MSDFSTIELILPQGLLNYFEVTQFTKEEEVFRIYLKEKNIGIATKRGTKNIRTTQHLYSKFA